MKFFSIIWCPRLLRIQITNITPITDFVFYSVHSLNLVGVNSVESCTWGVNYFELVQVVYMFFFCE